MLMIQTGCRRLMARSMPFSYGLAAATATPTASTDSSHSIGTRKILSSSESSVIHIVRMNRRWLSSRAVAATAARRRSGGSRKGRQRRSSVRRPIRPNKTIADDDNHLRKIWFQSLGCPRNHVDSEVMLGIATVGDGDNDGNNNNGSTKAASGSQPLQIIPTNLPEEADYLVVNTCGFLQSARDESSQTILECIDNKKANAKVIATGCMVNLHLQQQQQSQKQQKQQQQPIIDRQGALQKVDAILGSGSIDKIWETIQKLEQQELQKQKQDQQQEQQEPKHQQQPKDKPDQDKKVFITNTTSTSTTKTKKSFLERYDTPRFLTTPQFAYLKIAEGCKKRCSFCIIPTIKGRLQSKPMPQVIEEYEGMINVGEGALREVVLVAQDLGDYGKDLSGTNNEMDNNTSSGNHDSTIKPNLTQLLRQLLQVQADSQLHQKAYQHLDDKVWLRLLYLYPDEITPDLLDLLEEYTTIDNKNNGSSRLCPYLDLPIQHSHDEMLRLMRRKTTGQDIINTITQLRKRLPHVYLRTSLMVGFPGETEAHFEHLLQFVRYMQLDHVGVFTYSNEDLAHSSRLPNHVPEDIKQERYRRIMEAQLEIVQRKQMERVRDEQPLQVIVEHLIDPSDQEPFVMMETHQMQQQKDQEKMVVVAVGRHIGQCPDIDGQVQICAPASDWESTADELRPGERYWMQVTGYDEYDLQAIPLLS